MVLGRLGGQPPGTDRLVLAGRVMFDGLVGDAHTLELSTPGGVQRYARFHGSLNDGRDPARPVGTVKALQQAELRWTWASFGIAGARVDLGALAFVDLGGLRRVGRDVRDPAPLDRGRLRFALDESFVVRADVGVSPIEDWSPSVYIDLKNLF